MNYATKTSNALDSVGIQSMRKTQEAATTKAADVHTSNQHVGKTNEALNKDIFDQLGKANGSKESTQMSPKPKAELKTNKNKMHSRQRRRQEVSLQPTTLTSLKSKIQNFNPTSSKISKNRHGYMTRKNHKTT